MQIKQESSLTFTVNGPMGGCTLTHRRINDEVSTNFQ